MLLLGKRQRRCESRQEKGIKIYKSRWKNDINYCESRLGKRIFAHRTLKFCIYKKAQTFAIRLLGHHNHHTYMGMPAPYGLAPNKVWSCSISRWWLEVYWAICLCTLFGMQLQNSHKMWWICSLSRFRHTVSTPKLIHRAVGWVSVDSCERLVIGGRFCKNGINLCNMFMRCLREKQ